MRRIFSITDASSLCRTAIKAGDPNDPFWKLIMSGEPALRPSLVDRNEEEEEEEEEEEFEFVFIYSPPKSLKKHLPFFLQMHDEIKLVSVEHPSDEMNVVEIKVRGSGDKEDAFDVIRKVLTEDLELNIEDARG